MSKFLIILILGFQTLFTTLWAADNESSKKNAFELLQKFSEAFNQGKLDQLGSFWSSDAELTLPATGEVLEGRDAITKFLQTRSKEIKERGLTFSFKSIRSNFSDPNKASIEGIAEITDKNGLLQRNARKIELVKQNGQWLIDSVREIEVPPAPPVNPNLKELGWLVGNWKDTDEDVTITFNTHWDKFKNFISQRFNMNTYGVDVMEGIQVIGWDPLAKQIRSWVYDSDGGFGNGLWTKKENSWYAKLDYVLSDGTKGSATNIYTKINNNSYSFSSIDRKVGDQPIDPIEPVTVVKEE